MQPSKLSCPVAITARIIGGRWKARIMWALVQHGALRFSEIRRGCEPISDRILSHELKELLEWGFIDRHLYPVLPLKTEYTLSAMGATLKPVMESMAQWGKANKDAIENLDK